MEAVNPQTGERVRWNGSAWVPAGGGAAPADGAPSTSYRRRDDFAPGAIELPNGSIWRTDKNGRPVAQMQAAPVDPTDTKGVQGSAEQRGRTNMMFAPALDAVKTLERVESSGRNQFNDDWGARVLEAVPFDGGTAARMAGGRDYQEYESAARTFEAAVLPILSGAQVTDSEAKRMIRAALPQMGDDPATLADKARRRRQMIQNAARIIGQPDPFGPAQPQARQGAQRRFQRSDFTDAQIAALERVPGGRPGGQVGSRTNPRMIKSEREYRSLPNGAWYIDDGGFYGQKGRE